jgi:hypothetical protein
VGVPLPPRTARALVFGRCPRLYRRAASATSSTDWRKPDRDPDDRATMLMARAHDRPWTGSAPTATTKAREATANATAAKSRPAGPRWRVPPRGLVVPPSSSPEAQDALGARVPDRRRFACARRRQARPSRRDPDEPSGRLRPRRVHLRPAGAELAGRLCLGDPRRRRQARRRPGRRGAVGRVPARARPRRGRRFELRARVSDSELRLGPPGPPCQRRRRERALRPRSRRPRRLPRARSLDTTPRHRRRAHTLATAPRPHGPTAPRRRRPAVRLAATARRMARLADPGRASDSLSGAQVAGG